MKFRTEIEVPSKRNVSINHDEGIVMLGSCFTDNIGELLKNDGFRVTHNPMGPLYNPASIANAISLALSENRKLTLKADNQGINHCLDFATRYTAADKSKLMETVNRDLDLLAEAIKAAHTIIITLGTAYVFELNSKTIVGNCHKFPAYDFNRRLLSVDEISNITDSILQTLHPDKRLIFTVSPIRHTADGLHGNQISKSSLQLGLLPHIDTGRATYFPAYEIMIDDLRDYRFYADDLKHPSKMAVDYIYEKFQQYYMNLQTIERALVCRKDSKRAAHIQILSDQK